MFDSIKQAMRYFFKVLSVGCLTFIMAAPVWAQGQSSQSPPPPPAAPAPEKPQAAPAPIPREFKAPPKRSRQMPEEALEKKQVTDKVGGQEIRAKQGEEDK
ncbi:MAG: hypothetical protein WAU47_03405 [Desulfobaccales bacterium]